VSCFSNRDIIVNTALTHLKHLIRTVPVKFWARLITANLDLKPQAEQSKTGFAHYDKLVTLVF